MVVGQEGEDHHHRVASFPFVDDVALEQRQVVSSFLLPSFAKAWEPNWDASRVEVALRIQQNRAPIVPPSPSVLNKKAED